VKLGGLPHSTIARQAILVSTLMMAWQVAAKTTRSSLFLAVFPTSALPPAVGGAAVCSILAALFTAKLLHRFSPFRLIPIFFILGAALHGVEWILLPSFPRPVTAFIYVHILALGPLMLSGFWGLASERFDPREARRHFGQIAAFGTLGSLAGGLIAERVATLSSTPDLLILLSVLQLAAGLALFRFAPSGAAEKSHEIPSFPEMISGAPYLITLAAFVLLVSMSAATLDYLFNVRATAQFGKGPTLARFFAFFYAGTSVMTFLVQAGFSRIMLRRFGPGQTVSVLPIAVTGVGVITLFAPGAVMVIFSRGLEQLLRGSLYRTGYELFYTPMPAAERRSTKAAIDIGADRLGEGLAAAAIQLLLVLPAEAAFSFILAATVLFSSVAAWLALRLDRAYVKVLEKGLSRQTVVMRPEEAEDEITRSIILRSGSSISGLDAGNLDAGALAQVSDTVLRRLGELQSKDPLRARAALVGIDLREPLMVPQVITLLARDETARGAHDALCRDVERVTGQLIDRLADESADIKLRRRLPRILAVSKSRLAREGLFRQLRDDRFEIRLRCGRALEKIIESNPAFRPDPPAVFELVGRELTAKQNVPVKRSHADAPGEDGDFLIADEVLRERASQSLTHICTLLGLILPPQSVRLAFRALHTDDAKLRGVALEYLDSVLPKSVSRQLTSHLEGPSPDISKSDVPSEQALANLVESTPSIIARLQDMGITPAEPKKP
jgi:ATP:ADP antiporter, AAA family